MKKYLYKLTKYIIRIGGTPKNANFENSPNTQYPEVVDIYRLLFLNYILS